MNSRGLAIVLALGLGTIASPASSWPLIDVTTSKVVSVDPLRWRTTFDRVVLVR